MNILNSPAPVAGGNGDRKNLDVCTIVIFGASGDLTARKLIPALYHLFKEKQMPADFRVVGFARRDKTDASWRAELRTALDQFSRTKPVDEKVWTAFAEKVFGSWKTFPGSTEKLYGADGEVFTLRCPF